MESRRLKRYDSAPVTASSAATRTGGNVSVSVITRPQPTPPLGGPSPKPVLNASSSVVPSSSPSSAHGTNNTKTAASYETQLANYYRAVEEDNAELTQYYEAHTSDIAGLKVLAQERKFKEAVFQSMEAKAVELDDFLAEVMEVVAGSGRGLRTCADANTKCSVTTKETGKNSSSPAKASMDDVRDAVQKLRASLQESQRREEEERNTIRALEAELSSWKQASAGASAGGKGKTSTGAKEVGENFADFTLGTTSDLRASQNKVRDLERRLRAVSAEAASTTSALSQLQQQHHVMETDLHRREEEVTAMRTLLDAKEEVIHAMEQELQSARSATNSVTPRHSSKAPQFTRTNSAPSGSPATTNKARCGGETCSDRLVVTHHYRLLAGQGMVDGQFFSAASFKDAFLRSAAVLLHIPYGYLSSVEIRTHAEAVSVELDIRHSSRVTADEIDFLLLSHDYPELRTYLEKVRTERTAAAPESLHHAELAKLREALMEKDQMLSKLHRKLRAVEESLQRRDEDRAAVDTDVDAALAETSNTVTELYDALQAAQQDTGKAEAALTAMSTRLRSMERAKKEAEDAVATVGRRHEIELSKLKRAAEAAQRGVAEAKGELYVDTFRFEIPLATASTQRTAAALLQDAQQTRVLHLLALCHAGRVGAAIPVQMRRCVLVEKGTAAAASPTNSSGSDGASSTPSTPLASVAAAAAVIEVQVELAVHASKSDAEAAKESVRKRLREGGSCTSVQEYLRLRAEATRAETAAAADAHRAVEEAEQRAASAVAVMRTETQQTTATKMAATDTQLRAASARLQAVLGASAPVTATLPERVEAVALRLTAAERNARVQEATALRATRRLSECETELTQLQQTLSEVTARCVESRLAAEKLHGQVGILETQRRAAQLTADAKEKQNHELRSNVEMMESCVADLEETLRGKEEELAIATSTSVKLSVSAKDGDPLEVGALREALVVAKKDRGVLARQVREMETDMNDLSNIQAAMQRELESAQQELRAKKHDFDLLVKQLIRMEEREKKYMAEQAKQKTSVEETSAAAIPLLPLSSQSSQDSPAKQRHDNAERDDVARESLVILTNSNTTLTQCFRQLAKTMTQMGMDAVATSVTDRSATEDSKASPRSRPSGHRTSTLAMTLSRAAAEHQRLSTQLADLLLPMLSDLESNAVSSSSAGALGSSSINGRVRRTGSGGSASHITTSATGACRIVKHQQVRRSGEANAAFARTRTTPVVAAGHRTSERNTQTRSSGGETNAAGAGPVCRTPMKASSGDTSNLSSIVTESGGKTSVDAAPRLEFCRQNSHRAAFVRTASATIRGSTEGSSTNAGSANENAIEFSAPTGMPPACASTANTNSSSSSAAVGLPRRAPVAAGSASGSSSATVPATTKANPFRRSHTAVTSVPSLARGQASDYRRVPSYVEGSSATSANAGPPASPSSGSGASVAAAKLTRR